MSVLLAYFSAALGALVMLFVGGVMAHIIISPHHDELRHMIANVMGRGMTVYVGKRGFTKQGTSYDTEIIYCVITRLEIGKLLAEIEKIDPNAFVVMSAVKDTRGGLIKKRPMQH